MQIGREISNDYKAARRMRIPWWGILCIIAGSAFGGWLLSRLGRLNLAVPTFLCITTHAYAIAVKWKLKRFVWFWVAIGISVAVHVPLILFVPWTSKWIPAPLLVPFMAADWCAIIVLISIVGQVVERSRAAEA